MFLNPLFLIGALTAGVPLAIHLMHRRETRVIRWPSLRFLVASNRRTARRRQLEELLLLLLRMGLLAFLSVALSRPIIRAAGLGSGGETGAVIVLDNSMSMASTAAVSGDETRFGAAKRAAEEVLAGLPSGSWASLRLADRSEPAAAHAISKNRGAVANALRAARAGDARGDLGAVVASALSDAAESSAASAEVYVLTDLQAAAFARSPAATGNRRRPVRLVFVDCGAGPPRNAAVTHASVRARRFVAGAPLGIDVRLRSFSTLAEERKVVLEVDGEGSKAERLVKLSPEGSVALSFQVTLDGAGERTGRVYVSPADELPPDDIRYFRVHLAERIPVLVVERGRSAVASSRPSFFIAAALDPARSLRGRAAGPLAAPARGTGTAPGEAEARSPIVPRVTGPGYLEGKNPRAVARESPVAILADLGAMSLSEARFWVAYARAGGTVLAFPSPAGELDTGAAILAEAAGGPFLPAEIGEPTGDAEARSSPRRIDVERADFRHEDALQPFKELESTLKAVTVWRAYDLKPSHAAGGRAVLTLDDGSAFLAARKARAAARGAGDGGGGGGEIYLFAVPAGTRWSDLPARSLFLPLVHTLVYRAAAPREAERSFLAGVGARVSLPAEAAGKLVKVTEPGGRVPEVEARALVSDSGGGGGGEDGQAEAAELEIKCLARAGVYRIEHEVFGAGPALALVVNTDPEESDPRRIGRSRLRELYVDAAGAEPVLVDFARDPAALGKTIGRIRKGIELWDFLLVTVLGIALFECFYANRLAAGAANRLAAGAGDRPAAGPSGKSPRRAATILQRDAKSS